MQYIIIERFIMVKLNNVGNFALHLSKTDDSGKWQMQNVNLDTGEKHYVLSCRKKIKEWRRLEKALEFAETQYYNYRLIKIFWPTGLILKCKRELNET